MGTPPICDGSRFDEKAPGVFLPGAFSGSFFFYLLPLDFLFLLFHDILQSL